MDWASVMSNPFLKNLPFKIELNKWGQILMSPASNHHGTLQSEAVFYLRTKLPAGRVIVECSIETSDGVKVADVAWASTQFIAENGDATPYQEAPEICIEIISPSNSKVEMRHKIDLYLAKGAKEVWICHSDGTVDHYANKGQVSVSMIVNEAVNLAYE